jgi:hypothetical protein
MLVGLIPRAIQAQTHRETDLGGEETHSSLQSPKLVLPAVKTHPRYRKGVVIPPKYTKHTRTNGSRRKSRGANTAIKRWSTDGITIGSINIRGLTYMKLFMLCEIKKLDVLCV